MALSILRHFKLVRHSLFSQSVRNNGYVVLLPQFDENAHEKYPLLQENGLPEFNDVSIETCMVAIGRQALEFEAGMKKLESNLMESSKVDVFRDIFDVMEDMEAPLDMTWGVSKTLYLGNGVLMPTKNYLAIHDRARRSRATKFTSNCIYQNVKKELAAKHGTKQRTSEKQRILEKYALEGRLNGLELTEDRRAYLKSCLNRLATERVQFKQKLDYAGRQFSHIVREPEVVRDFPLSVLKATSTNSKDPMKGPWEITLDNQTFKPIMEYCPDRMVRWNLWQALVSRGSGYGDRNIATGKNLEEIRGARQDIANTLGFKTFADMSMMTKMAGNVENVHSLINVLLEKAKPAQDEEVANLYKFAKERGFEGSSIQLWDFPFWRRKQRISVFNFKEEEYRQYFYLPTVLDGLFKLSEKLFNITIKEKKVGVSTWHKEVRFYEVFEQDSSEPIAGFYVDCFARGDQKFKVHPNKGWMIGMVNRSKIAETKPLAALVFDFQAPTSREASTYVSLEQVTQLFHKFGLALQHLLTRVDYSEVSGSSNIEWDAVEVCGYVLTHWLRNRSVLDSISGGKLPAEMCDAFLNVQTHLAGLDLSRELYLSALDLELHQSKDFWLDIVKHLWPQFRSFPLDKTDSHPCSFTQIFTEEWAAAYYSNVWSKVIAADIYGAFHEVQGQEEKVLEVGKRFRDTFLALGGSYHPHEVFRKFRGRDPSAKALLASLGLDKKEKMQ